MSETGTTPTPRPTLLADTKVNTPIWERPSTWTGISKLLLDAGALGTAITMVPSNAPFYRLLVAVLVLNFLSGVAGQISTWCVRAGVTNSDRKTELLAERTAQALPDSVVEQVKPQ